MIKLCVYIFIGFENKQKFKTKILRLARVGIFYVTKNIIKAPKMFKNVNIYYQKSQALIINSKSYHKIS